MRGIAMEIQSHAHESHLNHQERHEHVTPETQVQKAVEKVEIHRQTLQVSERKNRQPKIRKRLYPSTVRVTNQRFPAQCTSTPCALVDAPDTVMHITNINRLGASAFRNSFVAVAVQ